MNKFRFDGSFVINLNGLPYHVTKEDNLYEQILSDYTNNPDNYETQETETMKYQNGQWVDISNTESYLAKQAKEQNKSKKAELQTQIDALDFKSIRAMRENSIKDTATGQTWIDYYTSEIQSLRAQLALWQ